MAINNVFQRTPEGFVRPGAVNQDAYNFQKFTFELLKRAQGVDKFALEQRQRDLQTASTNKYLAPQDESSLKGLAPNQIQSILDNRAGALSPDIRQADQQMAQAEQAIQGFQRVYGEAQKFGQDIADKMVAPDQVVQSYKKAIESNPDTLNVIFSNVNEKTRQAILQSLDYTKLQKPVEASATKRDTSVQEVSGQKVLIDNQTGQVIKVLGTTPMDPTKLSDTEKQNALDLQTVQSNYETIKAITAKYGKTPETFTAADAENMTDIDAETIAKVTARIQNPDVARTGTGATNALEASGWYQAAKQYVRAGLTGHQYAPDKISEAVNTSATLYNQRAQTGITPNTPSYAQSGGVIPTAQAESGMIRVRLKSTGQTGSLPQGEFDPNLYDKI